MATVRYTVVDGEVIAEKRNGVRKAYVPDPLGSTVALLDNTQTQTDTFSYWPYGEVNARTGSTPTPFQFVGTAGYYQDSSSKTYVRARHLDTQKGRWLTKDPTGFTIDDLNLYQYVGNMPIVWSDPTGFSFTNKEYKEACDALYKKIKTVRHAMKSAKHLAVVVAEHCGLDVLTLIDILVKEMLLYAGNFTRNCVNYL